MNNYIFGPSTTYILWLFAEKAQLNTRDHYVLEHVRRPPQSRMRLEYEEAKRGTKKQMNFACIQYFKYLEREEYSWTWISLNQTGRTKSKE